MRLIKLLEQPHEDTSAAYDEIRANASKPVVLKLQQALIDIGDWECEFEPPKPMDRETGEIYPWVVTATDESTDNKLKFMVSCSISGGRLVGSIRCDMNSPSRDGASMWHIARPFDVDANISVEQLAHKIKAAYKEGFDKLEEDIYEWFDSDISAARDEIEAEVEDIPFKHRTEKVYASARKTVKQRFIRKFLDPELRDWNLYYEVKSNKLINSKKLAETFVQKIKDAFEDAWDRAVGEPTT